MPFEELKNRHAAMWGSAPFERIAETLADMHERSSTPCEGARAIAGSTSAAAPVSSRSWPPRRRRR